MLNAPHKLWKKLRSNGGLELKTRSGKPGRDAELEEAIRMALGVPTTATSLQSWLDADSKQPTPQISTEKLLVEILKSQRGFGQMMREILDFFVMADAKSAGTVEKIEFRFDDVTDPIRQSLEEFRDQVELSERVLSERFVLPERDFLWGIDHVLQNLTRNESHKQAPRKKTFSATSTIKQTGHRSLDVCLGKVIALVEEFIQVFSEVSTDRDSASRIVSQRKREREALAYETSELDPIVLMRERLFNLPNDYWDEVVVTGVQCVVNLVGQGSLNPDVADKALRKFVDQIEVKREWIDRTTNELLDVLLLPAWKQRHDLYSVWVGTKLLCVAEESATDLSFNVVDGILSFSFGGNELARYSFGPETYVIGAEIRSPLIGRSSKRKKGIQPDFRVYKSGPVETRVEHTVLVLECKHYLKSNQRNFSTAAEDYARSCPNSTVFLANHGHLVSANLLAEVENPLRDRIFFLGDISPTSPGRVNELKGKFVECLFPPLPSQDSPLVDEEHSDRDLPAVAGPVAFVELIWSQVLEDVDLSILASGSLGVGPVEVSYRNKGQNSGPPYMVLPADQRSGPGRERIEIYRWHFSRYDIVATDYSKAGTMRPDSLVCLVSTGVKIAVFPCPERLENAQDSFRWRVGTIEVKNGNASFINDSAPGHTLT